MRSRWLGLVPYAEAEALQRAIPGSELRIYEDLPFREIAGALGISEGAAKVNFHYAVRKLRTLLSPASETGAPKGQKGKPR